MVEVSLPNPRSGIGSADAAVDVEAHSIYAGQCYRSEAMPGSGHRSHDGHRRAVHNGQFKHQ